MALSSRRIRETRAYKHSVSVKVYRLAWIKYCIAWPGHEDSEIKSLDDFVKANIIKGFYREERSDKEGGVKSLEKYLLMCKAGGSGLEY